MKTKKTIRPILQISGFLALVALKATQGTADSQVNITYTNSTCQIDVTVALKDGLILSTNAEWPPANVPPYCGVFTNWEEVNSNGTLWLVCTNNGAGTLTGVPFGGGGGGSQPQTPLAQDVNGNGFSITNLTTIQANTNFACAIAGPQTGQIAAIASNIVNAITGVIQTNGTGDLTIQFTTTGTNAIEAIAQALIAAGNYVQQNAFVNAVTNGQLTAGITNLIAQTAAIDAQTNNFLRINGQLYDRNGNAGGTNSVLTSGPGGGVVQWCNFNTLLGNLIGYYLPQGVYDTNTPNATMGFTNPAAAINLASITAGADPGFIGDGSGLTDILPSAVTNAPGFWAAAPVGPGGGNPSPVFATVTATNGANGIQIAVPGQTGAAAFGSGGWLPGTPVGFYRPTVNSHSTGCPFDIIPNGDTGSSGTWIDICDSDGFTNSFSPAPGGWVDIRKRPGGAGSIGTMNDGNPFILQDPNDSQSGPVAMFGYEVPGSIVWANLGSLGEAPAATWCMPWQKNFDFVQWDTVDAGSHEVFFGYMDGESSVHTAISWTNNMGGSGTTITIGAPMNATSGYEANGTPGLTQNLNVQTNSTGPHGLTLEFKNGLYVGEAKY
ncbi:MAG TPA: hypothetical protein VME24_03940 [Alphaproteobacteria bacterium]|nr:hypothetical protein [Alphaproteobacteria bacterium]